MDYLTIIFTEGSLHAGKQHEGIIHQNGYILCGNKQYDTINEFLEKEAAVSITRHCRNNIYFVEDNIKISYNDAISYYSDACERFNKNIFPELGSFYKVIKNNIVHIEYKRVSDKRNRILLERDRHQTINKKLKECFDKFVDDVNNYENYWSIEKKEYIIDMLCKINNF